MDSIELRSEKVRSIIGKIPSIVVRSGIGILFVVFILLFIGSYFFPYTETIQVSAQIIPLEDSTYSAKVEVPIALQSKIEQGLSVMIEIEGYSKNKYGQLSGCIDQTEPIHVTRGEHKYLVVNINLNNDLRLSSGKIITYYPSMQGEAIILLKKERLLKVIFGWMS